MTSRPTWSRHTRRTYTIVAGAGIAGLERVEAPSRPLGRRDVRVALRAAALNFRDLQYARGTYPATVPHPIVPLSDGVGEIIEIGPDATRLAVGDRVVTSFWPRWIDGTISPAGLSTSYGGQIDGTLSDELVAHEDGLTRAPRALSNAGAATIPCAGLTAWNALFVQGGARAGQTVLVLSTGSVATWALQPAVAAGLDPIVTSSSDDKLDGARKLGARATMNYRHHPEWQEEVLGFTAREGVDLVLEVGGEETLPRSLAATRFGGRVVVVGRLSGFGAAAWSRRPDLRGQDDHRGRRRQSSDRRPARPVHRCAGHRARHRQRVRLLGRPRRLRASGGRNGRGEDRHRHALTHPSRTGQRRATGSSDFRRCVID